jgi:hypothetical protein
MNKGHSPKARRSPAASLIIRKPRRLTEEEQNLLAAKGLDNLTWQEAASMLMTLNPEDWDLDYRRKHPKSKGGWEI